MKQFFYLILALVVFAGCNKSTDGSSIDTSAIENDGTNIKEPKFSFNETNWDFGKITEGDRVEHTFKFKNVGEADLIISNCSASCGCTIPDWPKEPIAPGETGVIKVEFNSAGKSDMVTKDITILANTNPVKTMLQIKVFVEKPITK